jgi:hypothetical protein
MPNLPQFEKYFTPFDFMQTFADAYNGVLGTAGKMVDAKGFIDFADAKRILNIIYFLKEISSEDINGIRVLLEYREDELTEDATSYLEEFLQIYPQLSEELSREGDINESFKSYIDETKAAIDHWEFGIAESESKQIFEVLKLHTIRSNWICHRADNAKMALRVLGYLTDLGIPYQKNHVTAEALYIYLYHKLDNRFMGKWRHEVIQSETNITTYQYLTLMLEGECIFSRSESSPETAAISERIVEKGNWKLQNGKLEITLPNQASLRYKFQVSLNELVLEKDKEVKLYVKERDFEMP